MESILIGKIVNTHGIKGEVKVYPYTDDIDNLSKIKEVYFDEKLNDKHKVKSCKIQKNMLIMKLESVNIVEEAAKLKDTNLYIIKEDISDMEDTYYVEDLIGMDVIDEKDVVIGTITYVFNTGANDVYEIKSSDNKEIYIPAIKDVVKKVDVKNKKMYIEMMEGLQ